MSDKRLNNKAANHLRKAAEALHRASACAVDAQPSGIRSQDDDLAKAVFAEIEAANAMIKRARTPGSH